MADACEHVFSTLKKIGAARQLRADMATVLEHLQRLGGKDVKLEDLSRSMHVTGATIDTGRRQAAMQALLEAAPPRISVAYRKGKGRPAMLLTLTTGNRS
jgi:hypothetical protein